MVLMEVSYQLNAPAILPSETIRLTHVTAEWVNPSEQVRALPLLGMEF
jgi:hypothetical protein